MGSQSVHFFYRLCVLLRYQVARRRREGGEEPEAGAAHVGKGKELA